METSINQAYTFCMFIINGMLIGLVFDIFRVLRKCFKTSDLITYIEDILFWIFAGMITLFFLFQFNDGALRFYLFLGIGLGVIIYILSLSRYFIKINVTIISYIKEIIIKLVTFLIYPIKIILKTLRKILIKPISFIFINIRGFLTKNLKKMSKMNIKVKNKKNNAKILAQKKDFSV